MPKFRKKPVTIEAIQHTGRDSLDLLREFLGEKSPLEMLGSYCFLIDTLKGSRVVRPGDWVIKNVDGWFHLCEADEFEATYEPVEE